MTSILLRDITKLENRIDAEVVFRPVDTTRVYV